MKKFASILLLGAITMVLAACSSEDEATQTMAPTPQPELTQEMVNDEAVSKTIVDIAVEDGRFGTLVTALQAAGLVDTLSGEGPFTVFAPTDDAFAALPDGIVAGLLEDVPALTEVLTYHVVSGSVLAEQVVGLTSATTLQGSDVEVSLVDDSVMIDGAKVIITDIVGSNGVIHVIDAVLLPATIAASLAESEDPMVVSKTIVDIAVEDGRFGTLVTALQAAGLVDTLSGEGPFTVFAPTDDAFAALPDGIVAGLLEDVPALTEVLTYHVV
ncbi:MAG: fasciclin domain-containing protein, partial [Dehalococcoidia bacterium]|nr:fasciclin domain-containing protein [Dehalococcoidia bacterium]